MIVRNFIRFRPWGFAVAGMLLLVGCRHSATTGAVGSRFNPRDYGAAGDGKTLDTLPIQRTIDDCARQGGRVVTLSAGTYRIGTIFLRDNVTLHLDSGAVLLGSTTGENYQKVDDFRDGNGTERGYCLVGALGARNIGLEGEGLIDGDAPDYADSAKARRPFLVRFVGCTNVRVSGVRLRRSGAWNLSFFQCENVRVERVVVRDAPNWFNDGIDLDSTQNAEVRDCDLQTFDDSICLKTTSTRPTRNISVSGCTILTGAGAFKTGSESYGDFENIQVSHCRVLGAGNGGIKLIAVDGADMSNIYISDIQMRNVMMPIFIRLGSRLQKFRPGQATKPIGSMRNIVIRNVAAENCRLIGALMSGIPDHPVQDVTLQNVSLETGGGGAPGLAGVQLKELANAFPDCLMFGNVMPTDGIFARNMQGLHMRGVSLSTTRPDARPAANIRYVDDLVLSGWRVIGNPEAPELLHLQSVSNALLENFHIVGLTRLFADVAGSRTSHLVFHSLPARAIERMFHLDRDVNRAVGTPAFGP